MGLIEDVQDGMGELFIKFLLHSGEKNVYGYSDKIWQGILSHDEVATYVADIEKLAKEKGKCCAAISESIPDQPIVNRQSFFGLKPGQVDAGFSIGTGTLNASKGLLKIDCGATECVWDFQVRFTLKDKYSFHAYDQNMNRMPWYTLDNNLPLRWLQLIGKEYDIVDTRVYSVSGSFPCH